jgi:large subunit ribosomal protein L28
MTIPTMAAYSFKPLNSLLSSLTVVFHNLSTTPKRTFATSLAALTAHNLPPIIPPYPYGPNRVFKQANSGLYGGSVLQFGNKISKGRNKGKTRRTWKPNIRKERLYSNALGKFLELKVQHRVLRTIKKVGGLDEYLLGDKPARIKELGTFGWGLRWKVMQSPAMRKRFRAERNTLGLSATPETFSRFLERHLDKKQMLAAEEGRLRTSSRPSEEHPRANSEVAGP